MSNPYPILPIDKGSNPLQEFASPKKALAQNISDNASASSVISVTHNTTALEVFAGGGPAVIRWVPRTETAAVAPAGSVIAIAGGTANFDNVIGTNEVRRFAIPIEVQGTFAQSVQGINRAEGLYQRVAIISRGVTSVIVSEF